MTLTLITKSIKHYKKPPIFSVLNKILELDIKKEIEIINFDANIKLCFQEDFFTQEKIQEILNPLFLLFQDNEVYNSYLKEFTKKLYKMKNFETKKEEQQVNVAQLT